MPNFRTHIVSGLISYPLVIALYNLISVFFAIPVFSKSILSVGYVIYVISSDAPDIDHDHAFFHKLAKIIVWISSSIYAFFFIDKNLMGYFPDVVFLKSDFFTFGISILFGMIVSVFFAKLMPRHRGPLHTIYAAVIYAAIIGGGYWYFITGASISETLIANSVYLGGCAFLGYCLHLILDKVSTSYKMKKNS